MNRLIFHEPRAITGSLRPDTRKNAANSTTQQKKAHQLRPSQRR
jgi:hypothetical protein